MKTIQSMLVATILTLYTFCTSCWYASSVIFDSVMPFVFVALSRVPSGGVCHVQSQTPGAVVSDLSSITWCMWSARDRNTQALYLSVGFGDPTSHNL